MLTKSPTFLKNNFSILPFTLELIVSIFFSLKLTVAVSTVELPKPVLLLVSLNIFADQQSLIKVGDAVKITAETSPASIRSSIAYIEPFYSGQTKTVSARAYINNAAAKIPVGSQVQATIFTGEKVAAWLPSGAVLSLGLNDIVFKKEGAGFRAKKVVTGIRQGNQIQIISGLAATDSVAISAQFLTESESFIQVKE